jgi:catechol 2,3-dioxygenase-like lactoylglutathione lyase family enzyme
MLRGLATVTFFADDLAAANAWYAGLLGTDPYFAYPDPEHPAYIEFRIGDYQHELGIIDSRYSPHGPASGRLAPSLTGTSTICKQRTSSYYPWAQPSTSRPQNVGLGRAS